MRVLGATVAAAAFALVLASNATTSFHGLVGAIAFDRPNDANVEIYAMDADGSNVRNLSNADCDLLVRNADGMGPETTLLHGGAGVPDWQALPHGK